MERSPRSEMLSYTGTCTNTKYILLGRLLLRRKDGKDNFIYITCILSVSQEGYSDNRQNTTYFGTTRIRFMVPYQHKTAI